MVKLLMLDGPPPGLGLLTVTAAVPAEATSLAGIAAVICVALTNVVGSVLPLNLTTEVETKFVPLTVSVNAAPPGECELPPAFTVVMAGTALLTVKFDGAEAPPPGLGLVITTGNVPPVAISAAVTAMVTCVELTKVTVRAVPLKVPVAPLTKFVPLIVRAKAAPPAVVFAGAKEVIAGMGLLLVSEKFAG